MAGLLREEIRGEIDRPWAISSGRSFILNWDLAPGMGPWDALSGPTPNVRCALGKIIQQSFFSYHSRAPTGNSKIHVTETHQRYLIIVA